MNHILEDQIIKLLEQKKNISVHELSERLFVSEMTIRRYLNKMQEKHILRRFHGGATLLEEHATIPENRLANTVSNAKRNVGKKGAEFLQNLCHSEKISSLAFLSGSTVLSMIQQIDFKIKAAVTTDSIATAYELSTSSISDNVIMIGGKISQPDLNVFGILADQALQSLSFDYCFTGIAGISTNGDLYCYEYTHASVINTIFSSSEHIVIMADHSKIGRSRLVRICPVDSRFILLTDDASPKEMLDLLQKKGMIIP